ncbi:MAG: ATP-dependent sacrificial sulfur transferase LarE [Anaerolineaceae bacterium]|jgi:uncharacterized protein|nr:MAG: ATP-dependent sacrificial sulfur transferase LarE [Anaerolineaceae bacterium]
MTIQDFFQDKHRVALAFSGGTDSAFLLYAAKESGCDIRPYYVNTPFQPQFELNDAQKLAAAMGVSLTVLEYDVLSLPAVVRNESDRCYHCKHAIFNLIQQAADADGCEIIIDGTNASDDYDSRPGMKALSELGVRSPLRECGLSKSQIRELSRQAGLFTWNKPAYACLATRIPAGTVIDAETLKKVEQAENFLAGLGFSDFRVRVFHGAAKIQLPKTQFNQVCAMRHELLNGLSLYFDEVLLDLKCRG